MNAPLSEPVRPAAATRAVDGRIPGRRGQATRRRLLDETRRLLEEVTPHELKVVDISRRAGTSPATFYQYFADTDAALLGLVEEWVDTEREGLRRLVADADWNAPGAAAALADGFLAFFEEHEGLLRVLDLATGEGDERFRAQRIRLLNGVFLALRELAERAAATGRLAPGVTPGAAAGVITTMLAHVSAHREGYEPWGVTRAELAATMAAMVAATVGADAAAGEKHTE